MSCGAFLVLVRVHNWRMGDGWLFQLLDVVVFIFLFFLRLVSFRFVFRF